MNESINQNCDSEINTDVVNKKTPEIIRRMPVTKNNYFYGRASTRI
jgi:hypothetical protein